MTFIQKRGPGNYKVRYRGPDKKERAKSFKRKVDAQQFAAQIEVDKGRGLWVDPAHGRRTLEAFATEWLDGQSHLGKGRRVNVTGHLNNHILPVFGNYRLADIQPAEIRAWFSNIKRSPATANAILGSLSRILETAVRDGVIGRNPCAHVNRRTEGTTEMSFLDESEIERLAHAIDERYEAMILLAAYGGLRWGEMSALGLDDVDGLRGVVHVRRSLESTTRTFKPPKNLKSRSVSVPRPIIEMVVERAHRYPSDAGTVFSSPTGELLDHSNWYPRHFKPAVRAAGLPSTLRFHDLRHTSVALAVRAGAHPKVIQERLGHSSIRLTLDRYGHLFPSMDEELGNGLERLFSQSSAASSRPEPTNVVALDADQRPVKGL